MEQTTLNNEPAEELLLAYLLGALPEAECAALEEQCFTAPEQYYRLCEAEQTLIDDYVRGSLTAAERVRFEQHFLTFPARGERVKAARTLLARIDGAAPTEKSAWWKELLAWLSTPPPSWIFAAAATALLAAGGWLLWRENNRLRAELASALAERSQEQERRQSLEQQIAAARAAAVQRDETPAPVPAPTRQTTAAPPLVLALTAGVLRSESGQALPTLRLPPAERRVQLRLHFAGAPSPRYAAVLQTAEGQVKQRWPGVKAQKLSAGRVRLDFNLPASRLAAGDYLLILKSAPPSSGVLEELTRAAFRVVRQ